MRDATWATNEWPYNMCVDIGDNVTDVCVWGECYMN